MIHNKILPCCQRCKFADIEVEKMSTVSLGQTEPVHIISCSHDWVCKYYLEYNNTKLKED